MTKFTKFAPGALVATGFAVFLYCIGVASAGGVSAGSNPVFFVGWIFIVIGIAAHILRAAKNSLWGGSGGKFVAVGWACVGVGIILDTKTNLSTVLITAGFILFFIGVLQLIPKIKQK